MAGSMGSMGEKLRRHAARLKPGVPKRALLFVAGLVWTFAGGMLFRKGAAFLASSGDHLLLRYALAVPAGLILFAFAFSRISLKHIKRIHSIDIARPCVFSFFDLKGYVMMGIMISGGILLRELRLIDPVALSTFYLCMGTPLLISAARFFLAFALYGRIVRAGPGGDADPGRQG